MTENNKNELHNKIEELNKQLDHLTSILEMMIDKMDRIEKATTYLKEDMDQEIGELKGLDFDTKNRNP